MKTLCKNLIAIGFGLLISWIFLEIVFRAASSIFLPSSLPKPDPNAYRIVCVGDSSTYGLGATNPDKSSYPAVLQELLSLENKMPIQVINLGLPGINSSEGLSALKKRVALLKPNLILVCVGMNDPWNFEQSTLLDHYEARGIEKLKITFLRLFQKSKVRRFIKLLFIQSNFKHHEDPNPDFNDKTVAANNRLLPDLVQQNLALKKTLRVNFLEFTHIASTQKSHIFFLEYHAPGWQNPEQMIHALYKDLKLNVIPVFDYFKRADDQDAPIRSSDHWHPNDVGYRLLAELVCTGLHGNIPLNTKVYYSSFEKWNEHIREIIEQTKASKSF